MADRDLGLKVFKAFWTHSRVMNSSTFTMSFDEFLASYGKKTEIYLDGIGMGIRESGISESRIDSAMRNAAIASGGKIPKNPLVLVQFLSSESTKIDWIDAIGYTVKESVGDIGNGFAAVGDSIITTGKILNFLLPLISIIAIYFWLNKKTEGQFSKAFKGIKRGL